MKGNKFLCIKKMTENFDVGESRVRKDCERE